MQYERNTMNNNWKHNVVVYGILRETMKKEKYMSFLHSVHNVLF